METSTPAPEPPAAPPEPRPEPRADRVKRHARRLGLYIWAGLLVVVLVAIVILAVQNTGSVRVGWIFGHSNISLIFLVLFATVLGWVLGIATSVIFRLRTRRSR